MGQISYLNDDLWGSSGRLQYYYQKLDQQFRWTSRAGGSNSRIESEKDGFRLDLTTPLSFLGDGSTLLWGAEYATDKSVQTVTTDPPQIFVPELEQTDFALFAQLNAQVTDRLTIQGGLRYDDLSLDLQDFTVLTTGLAVTGGSASYSSTVGNLGASLQLTEQFNVYAGFSQGFSLPDVGRVLRDTTNPNPLENIKPEPVEIDNYEMGVRFAGDRINATLAGFFNTSDLGETFYPDPNADPNDDFINYIVSRQAQDFWGVEATVSGTFADGKASWGGSYTWIDGEQDTDGDGDPDGPIGNTSIPPVKVTAYGDYMISDGWSVRLQVLYSGDRNEFPDIAATTTSDKGHVRSFWTADASTTFNLGPGQMTVAVTNLFNDFYFPTSSTRYGYRPTRFAAAPGAEARISYTIQY
jgi:iron complex outermembrane receptor protein